MPEVVNLSRFPSALTPAGEGTDLHVGRTVLTLRAAALRDDERCGAVMTLARTTRTSQETRPDDGLHLDSRCWWPDVDQATKHFTDLVDHRVALREWLGAVPLVAPNVPTRTDLLRARPAYQTDAQGNRNPVLQWEPERAPTGVRYRAEHHATDVQAVRAALPAEVLSKRWPASCPPAEPRYVLGTAEQVVDVRVGHWYPATYKPAEMVATRARVPALVVCAYQMVLPLPAPVQPSDTYRPPRWTFQRHQQALSLARNYVLAILALTNPAWATVAVPAFATRRTLDVSPPDRPPVKLPGAALFPARPPRPAPKLTRATLARAIRQAQDAGLPDRATRLARAYRRVAAPDDATVARDFETRAWAALMRHAR